MSASPYVLIAASTAVVGTLLVTELIRRRIGVEGEEDEPDHAHLTPQPTPPLEEIASEDFSSYEHLVGILTPPREEPREGHKVSKPRRQKRRKIGKRLEKRIIKMWKNGVPVKKIAEELGLSYSAVYRKIKKYREDSRR